MSTKNAESSKLRFRDLLQVVDSTDLMGVAGLGMLGTGLWWVWPPVSLIVCGVLLFAVAVLAARSRADTPTRGDD